MKEIKELTVKMTYRINSKNVEVSESVYNGLNKIAEQGEFSDDDANLTKDPEIQDAFEWLNRNIDSDDAMDWEYEIEDLEE